MTRGSVCVIDLFFGGFVRRCSQEKERALWMFLVIKWRGSLL